MITASFFLRPLTPAITHPLRATKRLSLDHCQHVQAPCSVYPHKKEKPFIYLSLCKHDGSNGIKWSIKDFYWRYNALTAFPCVRRNKPQKASRGKGNNELSQYWHNHAHLELWEKFPPSSLILFIRVQATNRIMSPLGHWMRRQCQPVDKFIYPVSYGNNITTLNCISSTKCEWTTLLHRHLRKALELFLERILSMRMTLTVQHPKEWRKSTWCRWMTIRVIYY